jgi:DNA-directed RNA polymerase subunit beta
MRKNLSKSNKKNVSLPNLLKIQFDSYNWLFEEGISEIIDEMGPIEDTTGKGWELSFSDLRLDVPNISYDEALYKRATYDAPWYLTATLKDKINKLEDKKEIYMGDIPLMSNKGTYVINGVEKIVINQLVRSEGVLFGTEVSPSTGKLLATSKIVPKNGVWLDIQTSRTGVITVKIDRRRKLPITTLFRIFGLETDEQIIEAFKDYDTDPEISYIGATLAKDPSSNREEAALEIYKKMRPGEPLNVENALYLVDTHLFSNPRRYTLGKVGRYKLNQVLGLDIANDANHRLLTKDDLIRTIGKVIEINNGVAEASDVDHLSNRRVKGVGEQLQAAIRVGFLQLEKNVKERMALQPRDSFPTPTALISARSVAAKVHTFFASGQLTQLQEQQNPISSLAHLRRISVLGPGGLKKERASFSVRDVHYSSFGKICPVRSPEGQSIGLINYLALFTRVNEYGFLETPYYKLDKTKKGTKVTDELVYLSAYDESNAKITDFTVETDEKGYIAQDQIPIRHGEEIYLGSVQEAEYIQVVPRQIVGVLAGLIPFLQNNDVARALMGTQQMSQSVPLVKAEAPLVGTGVEEDIAKNSGAVIYAEAAGTVDYADGTKVLLKTKDGKEFEYRTAKFLKTNDGTNFNQTVKVVTGQKVKKGDILIEGSSIDNGEASIGVNLVTAYTIFEGYEFEDGFVVSDRLVKDDVLTSVHVSEYKCKVLETKLGPEQVSFDIPNVAEERLRNLDESGIVAVGSQVKGGDILVGKVQPKGEVELTAEERLLRAIFGEKARDVRDTSEYMKHGEQGVVIGVKRVSKKENDKLGAGVIEEITVYVAQMKKVDLGDKLAGRHGNKGVISAIIPEADMPHLEDGTPVDVIISAEAVLKRMNVGQILEAPLALAGKKLGKKYTVPSLEPLAEEAIEKELKEAGLPIDGKVNLIDGRTGEMFDNPVLVGMTYVLKLVHISDEKAHARSIGPYSMVTQQPLGGKSQMGGQRLGEMEVWALEAYGAAHLLKEMLTIKSDDIVGRSKAYNAIISGQPIPESTVPESFKVLVRELNGLGIGIEDAGEFDPIETSEPAEAVKNLDDLAEAVAASQDEE